MNEKMKSESLKNCKHLTTLSSGFSEALITGKFCDVKIICQDSNLWAHRVVLSTVSPFLTSLLVEFEQRGDDVITIFLPLIKGYHMKLVLDYIYGGAMYLCGAHMQYVIQVMEVLQLKCGVSVNKMVRNENSTTDLKWIEVEHSTVRIKSNLPPNLPEPGPTSDRALEKLKTNPEAASSNSTAVVEAANREDAEVDAGVEADILDVAVNSEEEEDFEREKDEQEEETVPDSGGGSDDMVMVEIDEEFAINSLSSSEASMGRKHKCALCGRMFRFYENLRVHLTGHLGVKVSLSRCHSCRRNFKNQNELNLHMKSHSYARHLGKYRLAKSAEETARKEAKIITTVGSKDKKILRKYTKDRANTGILVRQRNKPDSVTPEPTEEAKSHSTRGKKDASDDVIEEEYSLERSDGQFTCAVCDKSFGVKSMYVRHINQKHVDMVDTLLKQKSAFVKLKKCAVNSSKKSTPSSKKSAGSSPKKQASHEKVKSLSKKKSTVSNSSPRAVTSSPNPYSRQYSTPTRKRESSDSESTPVQSKRRRKETTTESECSYSERSNNRLQCPDCDRVFVAKTIFDRHLYTAKHGAYSLYSSDSGPGSPNNQVFSHHAKTDRVVDCHLCGQKFMRVKDLAKHREKACTAWINA